MLTEWLRGSRRTAEAERFRGRNVVITGGSKGLGLLLAREFGLLGARVTLLARDAGELEEAEADLMRLSAHVDDLTDAGREPIADMLRPFYIEYLRRHGVRADSGTSA
jgi:NAD(P)-dependent dehydrogenase (short-subunit alcohol dehydrogenase family)